MSEERATSPRQTLRLDTGWRFHLGEVEAPLPNTHLAAYMANKAGWSRGAARRNFDDSDWRELNLPHDWAVEGTFSAENHVDAGFLPRGIGWYRRHFRLDESDRGKYLALQFDGVATHCRVYVNGHLLHRHFCGYTPFTVDISDVATFGDELNAIAVRVDATYMEGWWYEGAGIYRHAWLIKTSPLHIAGDGVYVQPELRGDRWETHLSVELVNSADTRTDFQIELEVRDPSGEIAGAANLAGACEPRASTVLQADIQVTTPRLWSLQERNLYQLRAMVRQGAMSLDEVSVRFGYRSIAFHPNDGFFLNGQPLQLKGTCNHQDHAGVGVAVPDTLQRFRIGRLLEMGSNAYRCAHNPPAVELLDACDELGMLVMDENRNFGSDAQTLEQLRTMVRRDRNHPCVITWSLCNEEAIQGTAAAGRIAQAMQAVVKELDPSRPVTAAVSGGLLSESGIGAVVEVMGINYQLPQHDAYHAARPNTPLIASETHCTLATRGCVTSDAQRHYFSADGSSVASWGATAADTWRFILQHPFVAGLFIWTGFDYRGEPTPHAWPCVNSHFGLMDVCGFEKDGFYLHQAYFAESSSLAPSTGTPGEASGSGDCPRAGRGEGDFERGKPCYARNHPHPSPLPDYRERGPTRADSDNSGLLHLRPHWNDPAAPGEIVEVVAYSNAESVELFLNKTSLGRRTVDAIAMARWRVPYEPGTLRAVAYRGQIEIAQATMETTAEPVAIGLEVHAGFTERPFVSNGRFAIPITAFAIDSHGRRVPTAAQRLQFSVIGPGKILGVGNGDPTCHEPDKGSSRSLFHGLAQVIVQTTDQPGTIRLRATTPGLTAGEIELTTIVPPTHQASVPLESPRHWISDWRMSPITPDRPAADAAAAEHDMNTWDRVDPAAGPQKAWEQASGYAVYRSTFQLRKAMRQRGAVVKFHGISGTAEISLNGQKVATKSDRSEAALEIEIAATGDAAVSLALAVLIHSTGGPSGISRGVELIGLSQKPTGSGTGLPE